MAGLGSTADEPSDKSLGQRLRPFSSFEEQALATLAILRKQFGFERWMINRLVEDQLVVEFVDPSLESLTVGSSFPWPQTVCARMVDGEGPCVAPSVASIPAYAACPQTRHLGIGAYAGVPLYDRDGLLWGTLCGTHPTAVAVKPQVDELFLHWIARSLTSHLDPTASPAAVQARNRRPGPSTILDSNMWGTVLDKEHERSARTGQAACVIELDVAVAGAEASFDVDAAALIDQAAQLVAASARGCDFVARTGTTRLGVLAVNCPTEGARGLTNRLVAELNEAQINARATVVDLLPRAEQLADAALEQTATITYMPCGHCDRRGAYISPRFPVLRCKYCGGRQPLSDAEWREALHSIVPPS